MGRFARTLLVTLALALPALAAPSQSIKATMSLRRGDSPLLADGRPAWVVEDPGGWSPLIPGGSLEPAGGDLVWLRIDVPAGGWSDPAILLGTLPRAGEVWVGGTLVERIGEVRPGSRPAVEFGSGGLLRLPREVSAGAPVYLRVQLTGGLPYTPSSRLVVGETDALVDHAVQEGLTQFLFGVVFLFLALALLLVAALQRSTATLGLVGFFAAYGILLSAFNDLSSVVFGSKVAGWAGLVSIPFAGASIGLLVLGALTGVRRRLMRAVASVAGLGGVVTLLLVVAAPNVALDVTNFMIALCSGALLAGAVCAGIEAWGGGVDARVFLGGLGVQVLIGAMDLVGLASGGGAMHTHWGALALASGFVVIHVRRIRNTGEELERRMGEVETRRRATRERAGTLEQSVTSLVAALTRLRGTTQAQHEGLVRQIAAIEESHVTIEEIRQTSAVAASKAERLLEDANRADVSARAGERALEASRAAALAMGGEVGAMVRVVDGLLPLTRRVADAVGTVKDLATQSNMLALNANIEASRTGAEMPGALSVARELRALADQSVAAATRIRDLLESANERVADASDGLSDGAGRVQGTLAELQASADQLRRLSDVVRDTASSVRQISATVAQQHAGVAQIFGAVQDLSTQVREMTDTVRLVDDAAGDVQHVVDRMQGQLGRTGAASA